MRMPRRSGERLNSLPRHGGCQYFRNPFETLTMPWIAGAQGQEGRGKLPAKAGHRVLRRADFETFECRPAEGETRMLPGEAVDGRGGRPGMGERVMELALGRRARPLPCRRAFDADSAPPTEYPATIRTAWPCSSDGPPGHARPTPDGRSGGCVRAQAARGLRHGGPGCGRQAGGLWLEQGPYRRVGTSAPCDRAKKGRSACGA
jgi:hypothetical protein